MDALYSPSLWRSTPIYQEMFVSYILIYMNSHIYVETEIPDKVYRRMIFDKNTHTKNLQSTDVRTPHFLGIRFFCTKKTM